MSDTRRFRLARLWRDIHLWLGAGLFLFLAVLGLTGSALVWETPIDQMVHPARYQLSAGVQPPSVYLAAAARAFGDRAKPYQLRMPREPGTPVTVSGVASTPAAGPPRPSLFAWSDPGSGRVLDVGDPRSQPMGIVHQLHGNLMLAQNGRSVVGVLGVAMLISSVTGLILWWPRGAWLKGLRWRRSPLTLSNLHHTVGFWICLPLAVLSLSGAAIAFPDVVRALSGHPAAQPDHAAGGGERHRSHHKHDRPNADEHAAPPTPSIGVDGAVQRALPLRPGARLLAVSLPLQKPSWTVQIASLGADPVTIAVDDATGAARLARTQQGPAAGDPVLGLMRKLHDGSGFGPAWEWIVTLTGLAPAILGVSGVLVWLTLRRRVQSAAS